MGAAFNNAAEFIEGRALVTPDSLERLVVNLAVLKFPDSSQDEALHLFFHHYVRSSQARGTRSGRLWRESHRGFARVCATLPARGQSRRQGLRRASRPSVEPPRFSPLVHNTKAF